MIRQGFAGIAPATLILGWLVSRYSDKGCCWNAPPKQTIIAFLDSLTHKRGSSFFIGRQHHVRDTLVKNSVIFLIKVKPVLLVHNGTYDLNRVTGTYRYLHPEKYISCGRWGSPFRFRGNPIRRSGVTAGGSITVLHLPLYNSTTANLRVTRPVAQPCHTSIHRPTV